MKKKFLLFSLGLVAAFATTAVVVQGNANSLVFGESNYSMVLDRNSEVTAVEDDRIHQIEIKDNVFDLVGYAAGTDNAITIKATDDYFGMLYNRSVLNGLKDITISFEGENLYYTFTKYLLEDLSFLTDEAHKVTSGTKLNAQSGDGYFLLYTTSKSAVTINSINVSYACDTSTDSSFIYTDTSDYFGARSIAKSVDADTDLVTIENNPTSTNNNYSKGTNGSYANSWYRWNGITFKESESLGTNFEIQTTILGSYDMMMDETELFNYSVWPLFAKVGSTLDSSSTDGWEFAIIGNDNYEPLGHEDPNRVNADYDDTYAGRFFTTYCNDVGPSTFLDPDVTLVKNGELTYREAFEANTVPAWDVRFRVNGNLCDVYINDYHISSYQLFEEYNGEDIYVHRWHMHAVNYGNTDGTPKDSYKGTFTTPRVTKYQEVGVRISSSWHEDNSIYAAYVWNDGGNAWFELEKDSRDYTYKYNFEINHGYQKIIFAKMKAGLNEMNWENKDKQTADLEFPALDDDKNYYYIANEEWNTYSSNLSEPVDNTYTVYVVASTWTEAYIYGWGGTSSVPWPGTPMTKESVNQYNIFSYVATVGEFTSVIFNNGSSQTADLVMPGKNDPNKYFDFASGGWGQFNADATEMNIYVDISATGWTKLNTHLWDGTELGTSWPGNAVTTKEGNYYKISFTLGDYKKIIFNNGSSQTADITLPTFAGDWLYTVADDCSYTLNYYSA